MSHYYKVFVKGDTEMKLSDRQEAYRKVRAVDPNYKKQFYSKASADKMADKIEKATGIKMVATQCFVGPSLSWLIG